ncbi:MAG: hypothetical protein N3A66_08445, partial [Planctomycetota bacterium]|nr:hypothetical protein [Planctomycetota bacterium]
MREASRKKLIAGVDIGGTKLHAVIADAEGKVLKKLEGNPRVEEIAAAMDSALKEWGPIPVSYTH